MELEAPLLKLLKADQVVPIGVQAIEERPCIHGIHLDRTEKGSHVLLLKHALELCDGDFPRPCLVQLLPQVSDEIFEFVHILHERLVIFFPCLDGTIHKNSCDDIENGQPTESNVQVKELYPEFAQRQQSISGYAPVKAIHQCTEECCARMKDAPKIQLQIRIVHLVEPEQVIQNGIGKEDTKAVDNQDQQDHGPKQLPRRVDHRVDQRAKCAYEANYSH
mmetsp:Transcript_70169/g.164263  ORF Transcript_70169/g.164263 Transcript_70169/m.164263 type:complete len:220 (-) Transcript_70169:865-1524(-)